MQKQSLYSEIEYPIAVIGLMGLIGICISICLHSLLLLKVFAGGTPILFAGVIIMSVIRNWYHNSTCKKEYISQRYYCYHTNTWFKSSYITKEMYREYIQCI
jgi:K+ transporter